MRSILIAALAACYVTAASADYVAKNARDSVRLVQAPCPASMAAFIPSDVLDKYAAAVAIIDGKTHMACWALRSDGMVLLVYSDGDGGMVPVMDFKHEPGT